MACFNGPVFPSTLQITHKWLRELEMLASMRNESEADSVLRAVLHALRDRLSPDERAKLVSRDKSLQLGPGINQDNLAHQNEEMLCFTCHTSWTTSCAGCHLLIQVNWKSERLQYEGGKTRNFATYNPQVVRDPIFQLGKHGDGKGNKIAPVRSSSALVLSSRNENLELIYVQQPPVAASDFSSQSFAAHFAHPARTTERKTCSDCHLSEENDNNAIMARLMLSGTNFVNFVGLNAWVDTNADIEAVRVTEVDGPQAVIGSYLHKYAYPDWYKRHKDNNDIPTQAYSHSSGRVGCLQLRGEYLYVAQGKKGMQVYAVANIANKGISQCITTAPFSSIGHDIRVESSNANCVVLPTNQRTTVWIQAALFRTDKVHPCQVQPLLLLAPGATAFIAQTFSPQSAPPQAPNPLNQRVHSPPP